MPPGHGLLLLMVTKRQPPTSSLLGSSVTSHTIHVSPLGHIVLHTDEGLGGGDIGGVCVQ